jgi:uncharacterized spore protein YtfJ
MSDIKASLETLFEKMEGFLTTKTVVSDPIILSDITIIPLVEVSFGVGAGAFDSSKDGKKEGTDGGGGGLGAKVSPSAVIVITDGKAKILNVQSQLGLNKLLELAPDILSKIPSLMPGKDSSHQ